VTVGVLRYAYSMHSVVGALLKEAREERGLTQGEVGRELGLSTPYISDVERGNRRVSRARDLAKWAGLVGAELGEVFGAAAQEGKLLVGRSARHGTIKALVADYSAIEGERDKATKIAAAAAAGGKTVMPDGSRPGLPPQPKPKEHYGDDLETVPSVAPLTKADVDSFARETPSGRRVQERKGGRSKWEIKK